MPFTDTWTATEQASAVNLAGVPNIDRPVQILNTQYTTVGFDTGIISVASYRTVAFVVWCDKQNGTAIVGDNGDVTITHYIGNVPVHVETLRLWTSGFANTGSLVFAAATRGRLWCRGDGIQVQGTTGSALNLWGLTLFGSFTETPAEEIIVGHNWQNPAVGHGLSSVADTEWIWIPNQSFTIPAGTGWKEYPSGFRAGPAKLAANLPAGTSYDVLVFVDGSTARPIGGQYLLSPSGRTMFYYDLILPRAPIGLYFANNTASGITTATAIFFILTQGVQG